MLKRIVIILMAIILLAGSAFADSNHLEMQFIIHNNNGDYAVTADALIQEDEMLLLSGLFPSYVISFRNQLDGLIPETDPDFSFGPFYIPGFGSALYGILQGKGRENSEGCFTGDLFDEAHTVITGSCTYSELMAQLSTFLGLDAEIGPLSEKMISMAGQTENAVPSLSELIIHYSLYDQGQYLTLNGEDGSKQFFTASFDFSDPSRIRAVVGTGENGANYYRVMELSAASQDEMHFDSLLLADPNKAGYRTVMRKAPVLTERWHMKLSETRKEILFTGELIPANEKRAIDISGSFSRENKPMFTATVSFRDWKKGSCSIYANLNDSQVLTDGLRTIYTDERSDPAETELLANELSVNLITFASALLTSLPDDYLDFSLLQN